MPRAVSVLYLDLDDTVREGYGALGRFVNTVGDVVVYPEAITAMRKVKLLGWRIVGITNQGGVALGYMTMQELWDTTRETQRQTRGLFDKIKACVHHPDAEDREMAVCWCRKPRPGLVIEAALELGLKYPGEHYPPHMALFVGDREEDRLCAEVANIAFMDAREWRKGSAHA